MLMMVISGGQTGADQGGLRAAEAVGIKTGGTMPHGFITHNGFEPELAKRFGMTEHKSPTYPPRTAENVYNADITVRFAEDFDTAGEKCTLKAIKRYKKPCFDVDVNDPPLPQALADWLIANQVSILNVAGNSERTSPGIGDFVTDYLTKVLQIIIASQE